MRLLHHKAGVHGHSHSITSEACAAVVDQEESKALSSSLEQPSHSDHGPSSDQSPKRHRRRIIIETFLANHHLSPQPRKEKHHHHRRRANSWHGGNKLIHLFHHERESSAVSLHENGTSEQDEQIVRMSSQSQTNNHMQTVEEEEQQQQQQTMVEPPDTTATTTTLVKKGNPFSHFFKAVEDFLFHPRRPTHHPSESQRVKKHGVLLYGCQTVEEHDQKVKDLMERIRPLYGKEGLKAIDLEYRLVRCDAHKQDNELGATGDATLTSVDDETSSDLCCTSDSLVNTLLESTAAPPFSEAIVESSSNDAENVLVTSPEKLPCHWCMQRLFHIPSGLVVDEENRKQFCADGDMYEEVARLCQEYAQDTMCQEGNLEWHVVEAASGHKEAIRMMVSKRHQVLREKRNVESRDRPTLLIATGRGKVRAGIFSRLHMMCSGLESATAIPLVREAAARDINVIVLDPNVHGDTNGFVSFTKCMDHYYHRMQDSLQETGLYVLSHSASGGHMARYLLDKPNEVLAHFHAIAFTDSTHNIQWTKKKAVNAPSTHNSRSLSTVAKAITDEQEEGSTSPLQDLLESEKCVYFRCAKVRRDGLELSIHPAGEPVQTDAFWTHRFGKIRTLWAGTDEHSLTNWYSHEKIWEHFDTFLLMERRGTECLV